MDPEGRREPARSGCRGVRQSLRRGFRRERARCAHRRAPSQTPSSRDASSVPSTRARILAKAVSREVDVVAERREPAVVRRAEVLRVDEPRRLEDPVADFLGGFDPRVERVDDADEDPAAISGVLPEHGQDSRPVRLACELHIEPADVEVEQRRQQGLVGNVRAVCGIAVTARAGVDPDPRSLLGQARTWLFRSTNAFSSPPDGSSLSDRRASVKSIWTSAPRSRQPRSRRRPHGRGPR